MMEWTVGIDKGKVVFKPGVVIPGKGEINLVIEPDQAIEMADALVVAALKIKGKTNINAYHPRASRPAVEEGGACNCSARQLGGEHGHALSCPALGG